MSEPKVQLVDPQGNMSVTGMSAVGVVTASSLDGISNSSATGITGNGDLDVGIVTATSFVGQGKGHAAGLAGTPELNLGVTTATSFVGDATGKAAGLTGTPNLNVGLVTATGFAGNVTGTVTGNVTGLAVSITPGSNLGLGVCTAIQYHGDGSTLTGAGSSAYIAQEITVTGPETIIDLSYGNLIYYTGKLATTVGFASTSAAEQITFIRNPTLNYSISYSTGGVEFDGNDSLSVPNSSDYSFGSGDFTVEGWIRTDSVALDRIIGVWGAGNTRSWGLQTESSTGKVEFYVSVDSGVTGTLVASGGKINNDTWHHFAAVRNGNTFILFINGEEVGSSTLSGTLYDNTSDALTIGRFADDTFGTSFNFNGKLSNIRVVKGTAVYTANFIPPSAELTNITNTKLLCCQSDSSTTTAAVIATGSITTSGDPTAGAETVSLTGPRAVITWPSRVKWKNNTTPTLFSNARSAASQIFRFTTVDTGLTYNAWEEMKNNAETFGLYGAGSTGYGALGINVSSGGYFSSPVQVPGTSWSSLSEDTFTGATGGAIKSDGTMWVWGKTSFGMLGLNVAGAGLGDSVSSPIQLGTETTWDNVCFGGNNSEGCAAVKTDGTLWAWGENQFGTLGHNNRTSRSSPTQVGTDTTWKWVNYGGEDVTLAIKTNGTLWSWGNNLAGGLGQNTPVPAQPGSKISSPAQVGTNTTWAYAANCRTGTSIATKTDGTLWCWGDNSKGQCGQNTNSPSPSGFSSPTQVGSGTDWNYDNASKIASGYQRVFAIKTDGTLYGWGRTHQGQLGLNEGGYKDYSSPTQLPGTNWATIQSVGEVIATKTDGTLWTWGDNGPGSLMLNDRTARSSPTQVPGIWSTGQRGIRAGSQQFALKVE